MEILFGVGGGLVVVFQHLFPVALVNGVAGLAGGGGSATFCADFWPSHGSGENWRKFARFDKIETLQDRF